MSQNRRGNSRFFYFFLLIFLHPPLFCATNLFAKQDFHTNSKGSFLGDLTNDALPDTECIVLDVDRNVVSFLFIFFSFCLFLFLFCLFVFGCLSSFLIIIGKRGRRSDVDWGSKSRVQNTNTRKLRRKLPKYLFREKAAYGVSFRLSLIHNISLKGGENSFRNRPVFKNVWVLSDFCSFLSSVY